jgi:hypothetical protein
MAKITRDLASTSLHPRENIFLSGNINAVNGEVVIDADGASTVALVVTGAYVGTLTVEGSIDGTNYDVIPLRPVNVGGVYVLTLASAAVGRWFGACSWARRVRVRMSAYTSGTATVTLAADNGNLEVLSLSKAADLAVTNTGAAAAAVTLTLAAPGAGLFQYITRLIVCRFATALLTAAATPVLVTTTNLPGTRVLSFPAEAALQGSMYCEIISPAAPLKATTANTAVTVVCPATTAVIWRATADYYNGV